MGAFGAVTRGRLRVYLGAAPGVGKTYAMLAEAHRRASRGTDVVVGLVETYGRARTAGLLHGLEIVPRRRLTHRGATFTELDTDAVIRRRPKVACIDEIAHTNVPGSRNVKRWQDVEEILDAGIDVISTVNIQHLESVNDVVQRITGVVQRETIPDEVVRRADQVELVDMAPEALRRRMAHGNVYAPEKIDAALANYFRVGNLTALRELALLWVAGKVEEQLDDYRAEHRIAGAWETRERVVVALTGGPEGETLIRRAARIAGRSRAADLLAVHITRAEGLVGADPARLARQRALVESLGGTYHQVIGDDVARALIDFARGVNATQLVLGASRRGRLAQMLAPGVGAAATTLSGPIDVHMITHEEAGKGLPRRGRPVPVLPFRRRAAGWVLTLLGPPVLTLLLVNIGTEVTLPTVILLFLLLVVGVALVGGMRPALTAAVIGFGVLNYVFTPPVHAFIVSRPENLLALVVYVLVAVMVSAVVDLAARRTREATRAGADAEVLSTLAGHVLRGEAAVSTLLERLRETFGLTDVTLLERRPGLRPIAGDQSDPRAWHIVATAAGAKTGGARDGSTMIEGARDEAGTAAGGAPGSGEAGGGEAEEGGARRTRPCACPGQADTDVVIDDELVLALSGRLLDAADRRVVEAFAAQAAVALHQERLAEEAERARPLEEADKMRTALLAAVSHDLRTPLASARAAVDSLRGPIRWSPQDHDELIATAGESLERLDRLVANLLDMSRLQAGVLGIAARPIGVEAIMPRVLADLGPARERVLDEISDDLPEVVADPALLERVLANLIANALRYNPPGEKVLVTASAYGDDVEVRIIDRGPGIPASRHDQIFLPFQRLGDRGDHNGVGLGLALARGLTEAMGGTLVPEDTPGGGLTMILTLPISSRAGRV